MNARRLTSIALVAATALLSSAATASAAAPSLTVDGNRLLDSASGATFVPRGVNWPSFEYACYYGYGYSNGSGPASVGPTAEQAALIASWHVNTVRIPLNQDCWLGDDGFPSVRDGLALTAAGYRDAVAAWVATLHAAGLAVILDLHWSGPNGVAADGQRMLADDRSPAFWSSVASRFRDDRAVLFDAFNEPFSRSYDDGTTFPLTWSCWRDGGCAAPRLNDRADPFDGRTFTTTGMQALVSAIRGTGARQPIMLGGLDYANDVREWLTHRPADDQLVASFHNYDGQRCSTVACWDAEIAPVAAQVPVVTGEFGETDCTEAHDNRYMAWADARGVGYLGWQWVVLAPDEQASPACASLVLISDVNGTPASPNGTALKNHLAALARGEGGGSGPGSGGPRDPGPGTGGPGTGNGPRPGTTRPRDTRRPRATRVSIRRGRGGRLVLRLTLDERATVRATLTRRGVRRALATVTRRVKRGRATIVVARHLRRGRYRLVVQATDAAGNRTRLAPLAVR